MTVIEELKQHMGTDEPQSLLARVKAALITELATELKEITKEIKERLTELAKELSKELATELSKELAKELATELATEFGIEPQIRLDLIERAKVALTRRCASLRATDGCVSPFHHRGKQYYQIDLSGPCLEGGVTFIYSPHGDRMRCRDNSDNRIVP